MSREAAEALRSQRPCAVISITDPDMPDAQLNGLPGLVDVLRLKFWDIPEDVPEWQPAFGPSHAEDILSFAARNMERVEAFIIHCEAGISRSTATAISLAEIFELPVVHEQPEIAPNRLVRRVFRELRGSPMTPQ